MTSEITENKLTEANVIKAKWYVDSISEYITLILDIWEELEEEIYQDIAQDLRGTCQTPTSTAHCLI